MRIVAYTSGFLTGPCLFGPSSEETSLGTLCAVQARNRGSSRGNPNKRVSRWRPEK